MSKRAMAILLASIAANGCFADDSTAPGPTAGSGGTGATGGSGVGGTGGATGSGATGGTGGSGGTGASSGAGGSAVDASADAGGSGGASGSTGSGGAAGSGGSAGTGGSGGAGTGGASGASGTGGSGATDAGSDPVVCVQGTGPASLPFAVDEFFTASGWMGDVAAIHMEASCGPDAGTSDAGGSDARPPDASTTDASTTDGGIGDGGRISTAKCWTITYSPGGDAGGAGWAGVDWQYPANNWGTMNGRVIPRGAKRVRFLAWGATGGEVVSFNVGYGFVSTDQFGVTLANQILTTTPTAYELDLTGIEYTCPSVRMGFGWTTSGALPLRFYIDDIQWQ